MKIHIGLPRDNYDLSELDLVSRQLKTKKPYIREDIEIKSKWGYRIESSFYRIDPQKREPLIRPVVKYLHGNSSRVEGKKIALFSLNNGIDLFVFDFPGCGKIKGEYISLGYFLFIIQTINYCHINIFYLIL